MAETDDAKREVGGAPDPAVLQRVIERIKGRGWHVVLHLDAADVEPMAEMIAALPVPIVIDHMGRVDTTLGTNQPVFAALLELVRHDHAWVKVCGSERISRFPFDAAVPFARALMEARPDRVLWGTDFPHPNLKKPGAGGSLAAREALNAEPDGHTLALFSNGTAVSVPLFAQLQFDPLTEFVPVSSLAYFGFLFVSAAQGPVDSLADFVRLSQESPDSLSVGTINTGSTQNLSAELLKSTTGVEFTIVPYRATPDLTTGLLGGEVDLIIDSEAALRAPLSDDTAIALATSGPERSSLLPDVPTAIEEGVEGFDVTSWNAIFAPAGTPEDVVVRLNEAISTVLADPQVQARFADLGIEPRASTPKEIGDRLVADIEKWGAVIREAGIAQQ